MFKSCRQLGPGLGRSLHPWKSSQACAEASSNLTSKLGGLCPSISKALWSGVGQYNAEIFLSYTLRWNLTEDLEGLVGHNVGLGWPRVSVNET